MEVLYRGVSGIYGKMVNVDLQINMLIHDSCQRFGQGGCDGRRAGRYPVQPIHIDSKPFFALLHSGDVSLPQLRQAMLDHTRPNLKMLQEYM